MPETYGLPEPEPTRAEQAQRSVNEVLAGQGVVRRVALYLLLGLCLVSPVPVLGIAPLVLLMASDGGLS